MIRNDGIADKVLKATVYTWRDVSRNLVGFVYRFWDTDRVSIVYFSVDLCKTAGAPVQIRVHHTRTAMVNDPDYVVGERIDTPPDPDNDPQVGSLSLKQEDLF